MIISSHEQAAVAAGIAVWTTCGSCGRTMLAMRAIAGRPHLCSDCLAALGVDGATALLGSVTR